LGHHNKFWLMSEASIQQHIRLALGKLPYLRLFRNNCGKLPDPRTGRWVEFGVGNPGGGDLLGWRTVEVTPEMVGQRVAVFTSIEVKTPTGKLRAEQEQWMKVVRGAGGIAGVARSVEDAEALVRQGSE
jgi:hypothetical protein